VTGLNASAGISYNKFLAKLASDHRKPDGQYVISPEMGPAFVEALPVGKFHGIGPATSAKMNAAGRQPHVDAGNGVRDRERVLRHLTRPAAVLNAPRCVVEGRPGQRHVADIGRRRRERRRELVEGRSVSYLCLHPASA
jgi:hypothetical protein